MQESEEEAWDEEPLPIELSGRYGPVEKELGRKDGSTYPVLMGGFKTTDPQAQLNWPMTN